MTVQINDLKKGVVPGGGDTFDAFRVSTDPERRYAVVELIPNALFVAVRITSIDDRRLVGNYVNLPYTLPSGAAVQFLNDAATYLGNQLESEFGGERCFGVLANMDFILISTYGKEGADPELVLYKKR